MIMGNKLKEKYDRLVSIREKRKKEFLKLRKLERVLRLKNFNTRKSQIVFVSIAELVSREQDILEWLRESALEVQKKTKLTSKLAVTAEAQAFRTSLVNLGNGALTALEWLKPQEEDLAELQKSPKTAKILRHTAKEMSKLYGGDFPGKYQRVMDAYNALVDTDLAKEYFE